MNTAPLRLCEYQSCLVEWSLETRKAVLMAAESWRQAHALPKPPLSFGGPDGSLLRAEQYVGVVEAGGVRVEIYPKLDAAVVRDGSMDELRACSVMANLLWLLKESGYGGLVDAGEASVHEGTESITDLLAWLFARRLRQQLGLGLPHEYRGQRDDLNLVRGSIQFSRQATVHFGRPDRLACAWDELSADTPLARILRCAAEALLARVRLPGAAADLRDGLAMLDDAQSVHPMQALSDSTHIRWSRLNSRWRPCHDLAQAVLRGLGRELHSGGTESFVFLLDMNALFESFCARWIEKKLNVSVHEQVFVGKLLMREQRSLHQYADFLWRLHDGTLCVGDSKYKTANGEDWPKIDDTRQLICYGQLAAHRHGTAPGSLMLLYPTTGAESSETVETYDRQRLTLQAVRVVRS